MAEVGEQYGLGGRLDRHEEVIPVTEQHPLGTQVLDERLGVPVDLIERGRYEDGYADGVLVDARVGRVRVPGPGPSWPR
jgi:hypothetical protein